MSIRAIALDLSDAGLVARAERGDLAPPSPGYAVLDGDVLRVGERALATVRLRPRFASSRFWDCLDEEPLGPPFPEGLRFADLVHAHLQDVWARVGNRASEVVLAVPGVHDEPHLGLLLGIARALAIPVVGMVDAAVAAAASAEAPGDRLLHVDLLLHRAVVTEIRQGATLARERQAGIERWGLVALNEALAARIAEVFVRQSRFDPTHAAETEQALYDRLPGWLKELEAGERARLALPDGRAERAIEVTREDALAWAAPFVDELAQQVSVMRLPGEVTTILLSARAAGVPGLVPRLASARATVATLPISAAASGALAALEAIRSRGPETRFLTQLPRPSGAQGLAPAFVVAPAGVATPPTGRPTHVLHGHLLWAITSEPLVVGTAPPPGGRSLRIDGETAGVSRAHCRLLVIDGEVVLEDLSTYGTLRNGEPVRGRAVLAAGDRLRVGSPGHELLLVAEREG